MVYTKSFAVIDGRRKMDELEPWQPVAIMAAYLVTAFGAALFGINKYYNSKFKKIKTDREKRKDKLEALRRKNEKFYI